MRKSVLNKIMGWHRKEEFMKSFDTCDFVVVNFFYVNSPSWQYAKRRPESLHNMIFVTEGVLYMELEDKRYASIKQFNIHTVKAFIAKDQKYVRGNRRLFITYLMYKIL